nr:cytochrome P450 [Ipomoea batatas]
MYYTLLWLTCIIKFLGENPAVSGMPQVISETLRMANHTTWFFKKEHKISRRWRILKAIQLPWIRVGPRMCPGINLLKLEYVSSSSSCLQNTDGGPGEGMILAANTSWNLPKNKYPGHG